MFGQEERKVKGKKNFKENKMFFFYIVWYVEKKKKLRISKITI